MTAEGFNIGLLGAFNNKGNEFDVPSSPVSAARRLTADMSKEYGQMVDETIHLWSKMVVDESDEKNRIFTNIRKMQTNGRALQNDLQVKLDSLLKVALEGMSKIAEFHLAAKQDKRLRHLKRAFLGVFMHRQLTRAMVKWSAEVLRTRKAAKAAKMAFRWKHRVSNLPWPFDIVYFRYAGPDAGRIQVIAQAWSTWGSIFLEQKRLRSILVKVALRWKNRVRTMFLSCITI
jgi:hypothetical protein